MSQPFAETKFLETPQVGASIALHPPKFYAAAVFLEQYAACPAARAAFSVYIVFTSQHDLQLFQAGLDCFSPYVPADAWTPVVAKSPKLGWNRYINRDQAIAAYKKWHGITYMMDLENGPKYGLMMDSELLLYDKQGGEDPGGEECFQPNGWWSRFLSRIEAKDMSKEFPAARVSSTLVTYQFSRGMTRSGKDYDERIIKENFEFVAPNDAQNRNCQTAGCKEVHEQVANCLYSWWTDLPWLNLTVAKDMLVSLANRPTDGWMNLATGINFVRFEYIGYQQWCVLKEHFRFKDVTNITGEAKWGSYMEDPLPGSRLAELSPLWISGQALQRMEEGELPPLSKNDPPLIIFHADQGRARAQRSERRSQWEGWLLRHGIEAS